MLATDWSKRRGWSAFRRGLVVVISMLVFGGLYGPDIGALASVAALYVFDSGPDGTIGDASWIAAARESGKLPLLVVQGVLLTDLAKAADFPSIVAGSSSSPWPPRQYVADNQA